MARTVAKMKLMARNFSTQASDLFSKEVAEHGKLRFIPVCHTILIGEYTYYERPLEFEDAKHALQVDGTAFVFILAGTRFVGVYDVFEKTVAKITQARCASGLQPLLPFKEPFFEYTKDTYSSQMLSLENMFRAADIRTSTTLEADTSVSALRSSGVCFVRPSILTTVPSEFLDRLARDEALATEKVSNSFANVSIFKRNSVLWSALLVYVIHSEMDVETLKNIFQLGSTKYPDAISQAYRHCIGSPAGAPGPCDYTQCVAYTTHEVAPLLLLRFHLENGALNDTVVQDMKRSASGLQILNKLERYSKELGKSSSARQSRSSRWLQECLEN